MRTRSVSLIGAPLLALFCTLPAASQKWTPLANQPTTFDPIHEMLLTDGTVMVEDGNTCTAGELTGLLPGQGGDNKTTITKSAGATPQVTQPACQWWKLTPDIHGSYVNGTWTQLASMNLPYAPLYFSSAVLADGRVVVMGGEYNFGEEAWTNQGQYYDPVANAWYELLPPDEYPYNETCREAVTAPAPWESDGDAQSVVLADGRWMAAEAVAYEQIVDDVCQNDYRSAILDPTLLGAYPEEWSDPGGQGKLDGNDEEGYSLLPDGSVLTVSAAYAASDPTDPTHWTAQRFIPSTGTWISAGTLPYDLVDTSSEELGPAVLRPDGTVFYMGATKYNAIYHPPTVMTDTGYWTPGPIFPTCGTGKGQVNCGTGITGQLDIADGPASILPDGDVLMVTSPGVFNPGLVFFTFDGTKLNTQPGIPNSTIDSSYYGRMLALPTGEIMWTDGSTDVEIYDEMPCSPNPKWAPTISHIYPSSSLLQGETYSIDGTQFNGLSQGGFYGDDDQDATNYPLVRICTNKTACAMIGNPPATGEIYYLKTHNHSTMGVATGNQLVSTQFDVPSTVPAGEYWLVVVANGIPSKPIAVTVAAP